MNSVTSLSTSGRPESLAAFSQEKKAAFDHACNTCLGSFFKEKKLGQQNNTDHQIGTGGLGVKK